MKILKASLLILIASASSMQVSRADVLDRYVDDASLRQSPEHPMEEAEIQRGGYPPCVGLSNGTAHAACGTSTGGPSGGLF